MAKLVGAARSSSGAAAQKLSFQVALAIEEDLLREGWDDGELIGSQADIQNRFGIGRWAFRETAKVLEVRGSARMKRGPGGGLKAVTPKLENFSRRVMAYMILSRGHEADIAGAIVEIHRLMQFSNCAGVAIFLVELLTEVRAMFADSRPDFHRLVLTLGPAESLNDLCYARQLAVRIIDDIVASDERHPHCIGSEWDLAGRYGYRMETVRQASRILEGIGLVEAQVGRNGGIFTRQPQLMLSHAQLLSYLETRGVTPVQARDFAEHWREQIADCGNAILAALSPIIAHFAPANVIPLHAPRPSRYTHVAQNKSKQACL